MKRYPAFLVVLGAAIIQVTLAGRLKPFGIMADFFIIALVASGLFYPHRQAFVAGLLCGILKDSFGAHAYALNTILSPLWVFLVLTSVKRLSIDSNSVRAGLVSVIALLNGLAIRIVFWYAGIAVPLGVALRIIMLDSLFTGIVSFFLFKFILKR